MPVSTVVQQEYAPAFHHARTSATCARMWFCQDGENRKSAWHMLGLCRMRALVSWRSIASTCCTGTRSSCKATSTQSVARCFGKRRQPDGQTPPKNHGCFHNRQGQRLQAGTTYSLRDARPHKAKVTPGMPQTNQATGLHQSVHCT